ncbi:MAG: 5'-3' exonuclease H3TH domain-containing protein [Candidatus Gracilibacteria bacterium]|nr:5'-3' exonuclease H3TH domain-containing protein [Candidatus Gracilibacteria bacterium]
MSTQTNLKKDQDLFIVLDGNAIMHRSYHALPPLTTRDGELVNAVFGFASILMTILTQEEPTYILATFDTAAPTFRHEMYTEYKAGRKKADQEFYDQIPRIHELVKTFNIPILKKDGVEADDIIGTIVKYNEKNHPKVHNKIVTSDMDAMQLVTNQTCVGTLHKGYKASTCFYPNEVFEKYLIYPDQVVDYKSLMGDPSDNIPGVRGIGKKGAQQLLSEFKTLDGIYENLDKIKGKKQEYLRDQKKEAYFSQQLATIKCDVETEYNLEDCRSHDFDGEKVRALLESLQFYSLIRRLGEWQKTNGLSQDDLNSVFEDQQPKKEKKTVNENQSALF